MGVVVLLASGEWRPGMLLDTLQHTGHHAPTKNYLAPSVSSAAIEKPGRMLW